MCNTGICSFLLGTRSGEWSCDGRKCLLFFCGWNFLDFRDTYVLIFSMQICNPSKWLQTLSHQLGHRQSVFRPPNLKWLAYLSSWWNCFSTKVSLTLRRWLHPELMKRKFILVSSHESFSIFPWLLGWVLRLGNGKAGFQAVLHWNKAADVLIPSFCFFYASSEAKSL